MTTSFIFIVSIGVGVTLILLSFYNKDTMSSLSPLDPSSYSRPELAVVTNIQLNLEADFTKKIFKGHTILSIKKVAENVNEVILDSKDLHISNIVETELNQDLKFTIGSPVGELGSKLTIELPAKSSKEYTLKITYETNPSASGLQWLPAEQTAGKKQPFLFSQFQAVDARSVVPCQDTPGVKAPYSATITAPSELTVLMSAIRDESKSNDTVTHFVQKVPMPSYLIAIAIGALESRTVGPRSKVWAEKEQVDLAAKEFEDTDKFLTTAEEICGPYVWGIYDLLVLPPSFPFGGMENPCLTFVTPTLLAGDKSLVSVIAHEISHSWTGNLVTNRNFEHFWLNEGFTVFIERKIIGRIHSPQFQDFAALGGLSELREAVEQFGPCHALTKLVIDLKGVHPDDAFSRIPYEKGQTFLRYLESVVGGPEKFEPFLRNYFDLFKYKSIETNDFKTFFLKEFAGNANISQIDWDAWLFTPGMPLIIPDYDASLTESCKILKDNLVKWNGNSESIPVSEEQIKKISSPEIIFILQEIVDSEPQSIEKLKVMEKLFHFDTTKNSEILYRWLRIGLKAHWEEKIAPTLTWLNEIGRVKYVRPLYRDLYAWELARPKAIDNFKANRKNYMHVTAYTVAQDLHLNE